MAPFLADERSGRPIPAYKLPEHAAIARLLRLMKGEFLTSAECWFGGGTAIVMKHDEYRLSRDVDFMCSSQDGYRTVRQAVTAQGCAGLFDGPVKQLRDFRCDQYGLRTAIEFDGQTIKLEIVREGRLELTGAYDPVLGCPLLCIEDQFAEKMLANSDRGRDPSVCYRDALDLGVLIARHGHRVPDNAAAKAMAAYGDDVWRDARRVVNYLAERPGELLRAATTLKMEPEAAREALDALAQECDRNDHQSGTTVPDRPHE